MNDCQFENYQYQPYEIEHKYGTNIKIVSTPMALTRLAVLGRPETTQPIVNFLIADLYRQLLSLSAADMPMISVEEKTRMTDQTKSYWQGKIIDPDVPYVCVGIARAGTWPAQVCFDTMCQLLGPKHVRLDHLYMARAINEEGSVQGTIISGHKVGGSIQDAVLIIPDPMGATGGTIVRALKLYKELNLGIPKKIIALHLIVTPEYIRKIKELAPDLMVYSLRLDRGSSSAEDLQQIPGENDTEQGLNEFDYIVPGLGGVGEIMTNSYV